MSGRAGRTGKDTIGESVMMLEKDEKTKFLVCKIDAVIMLEHAQGR